MTRGASPEQLRHARACKAAQKQQSIIDRDEVIAGLIRDLGREPTEDEKLKFEGRAVLIALARSYERKGKLEKAAAVWDQLARFQRANRSDPAPAAENNGGFLEFQPLATIGGGKS